MYREKEQYGQDPRLIVRSKTKFNEPLKWHKPAMVFTCSWSDFFIEEADEWRDEAWEIIRKTPHLTYQILTKRIERASTCLPKDWPFPNVWLGVSVESEDYLNRIEELKEIPAAIRWVSYEPALEAILFQERDLIFDWIVVGGESGPGARPFFVEWIDYVLPLRYYGIKVFIKQLGALPFYYDPWGTAHRIRLKHKAGADPLEWPPKYRIQEFPK